MSEPPTLLQGDCFEVLQTLEADSIDSCVCDPPYGLNFMGRHWDRGVPATDVWEQVYRVLKPGAHLLSFFGTRTYHRGVVAIEDAGFEIRDQIGWLYGSGFPKSLDVSKAIDKTNGEIGRLHKFTAWMRTTGLSAKQINDATDTFMGSHYLTEKSQPAIPTPELWSKLRPLCDDVPAWVDELVERIEAERKVTGKGVSGTTAIWADGGMGDFNITAPATEAAQQWDGWGTALSPAWEPICVARKPLIGTVATNILTHGTGGLNINDCRVMTGQRPSWESDQNLCSSCAARAASEPKPTTPATKESTATSDAGRTTSARGGMSQPGTSKTATGCFDGTKAGDTATSLSTAECGKMSTDPSQRGTKSTTSTKTAQTTGSKTCASCSKPTTSQSTNASTAAEQRSLLQEQGRPENAGHANAPAGRWPKNVIHDGSDEVLAEFAKYGERSSGSRPPGEYGIAAGQGRYNEYGSGPMPEITASTGTAARFFYTAKASKDDRNDGLDSVELVTVECSAWGGVDQKAVLRVDTAPSVPRVIGVSGVKTLAAKALVSDVTAWSMLLFGSDTTDPCPMAITSITETETSSIMTSPTLRWLRRSHTSDTTAVASGAETSGGSLAESAEPGTPSLTITSEWTVSARGVERATSPMQLRISASARRAADHPTVKPTSLMRYLVRLVTPKGGLVLDPFAGSGTTLIAAYREDCRAIGIELDPDYHKMASHRIDKATSQLRLGL